MIRVEGGADRSRTDARLRAMPEPVTAPPTALTIALALVVVQTGIEAAFVVTRSTYGPGGKGLVIIALGLKVVFAAWARRLSAAGVLGLLTLESVGILVAIGSDEPMAVRLGLVACVVAVFALVLSSLRAFPPPELP